MISPEAIKKIQIQYVPARTAGLELGISARRITRLAQDGRIPGAVKIGGIWAIPIPLADPRLPRGRPSIFFNPQKGIHETFKNQKAGPLVP